MQQDISETFEQWAQAYQQAAQEDQGAWLCSKSIYQHDLPDEREPYANELLESVIWTVSFVIAQRHLERPIDQPALDWTKRFLELQCYGLGDEERGARYEVVLVGGLDVPLFADRLGDLSFDDLRGGTEYEHIVVVDHAEGLDPQQAEAIAQAVHEDVNRAGCVHTYWQHGENMVLLCVENEPGEAAAPGQLRNAGPLEIQK